MPTLHPGTWVLFVWFVCLFHFFLVCSGTGHTCWLTTVLLQPGCCFVHRLLSHTMIPGPACRRLTASRSCRLVALFP